MYTPKSFNVIHFQAEGLSRSTLFRVMKRKGGLISSERQSGTGRSAKIMTNKGTKHLVELFSNENGISQRSSQSLIYWKLKSK